ncbi:MAG: transglycosylase SLT domain-containing protein, partial [Acidobacteria bacterium]|nr:transglycosylase SLT domain-containing protein [Acidobacteriota bacterium]
NRAREKAGFGLRQIDQFLRDIPAIVRTGPAAMPAPDPAHVLMQKAEQRMQRGRRFYEVGESEPARAEFNAAVDLMLQAGDHPMADRQAWQRKLEGMVDAVHRYDLAGLGAAINLDEQRFEKAPLEDILQMTFPVDPKLKTKVKEQALATASQLPLSINDAVLGYIHYFTGRGRKTLVAGYERAGRYREMIRRILGEEGVPQELIYLAQAESGFLPRAVSRKAATGMWQFVAFRGQQYGLKRTAYTDDRLDPEKATRAAARHLRDLYQQFGDWYLAIAAYNCGPGVVEKAVERTGYADFWQLRERRVIPGETANYVPIILAMTIMAKNASAYGLEGISPDVAVAYDDIDIVAATHLALVADLIDVSATELAQMNPALLKGVAPEGYKLHVPKGTGQPLEAALERVPAQRRATWRIHRVAGGDTLASIGRRYNATPTSIAAVNPALGSELVEGERLLVPAAAVRPAPARRTTSHRTARRTTTHRASTSRRASTTHRASTTRRTTAASAKSRSRTSGSAVAAKSKAKPRSGASSASARSSRKSGAVLARNASGRTGANAASN